MRDGAGKSGRIPTPLPLRCHSSANRFAKAQEKIDAYIAATKSPRLKCIETRVPPLQDKLENALNEGRILMLGVQVLIGFDYNAAFQQKFTQLPQPMQDLKLASLGLLILSLAMLFAPIPYHWILGRGRNHEDL